MAEVRKTALQLASDPATLPADVAVQREATEAFVRAATETLRQWQYERSARAAVSFPVAFIVRPGSERTVEEVTIPTLTKYIEAVAPPIAKSARVRGNVFLEAMIGTDGRVSRVLIAQSIPLLDKAAIDAVQQWEYIPTQVNGQPISIQLPVVVTFP